MAEVSQHWYAKLNDEFAQMAGWLQSPLLLAVRLYWGVQFMQTGWGKLHTLARVTDYFTRLGIPAPGLMVHFVAGLEFVGGLLLILGLASRFTGMLLAGDMIVAYYAADRDALKAIFTSPDQFTKADPYTFLFASVLIFVFGAGALSVDYLLRHHFEKKRRERAAKFEAAA